MFYSIIILHWTLNTTNYLRPKGRSFWKKRWRLSDTSVCFIWIWKPEVCVGVIGRSPRGVASAIEREQHYPEYFHLQRLANVQLLPSVKRKSSICVFIIIRQFWENFGKEKWIKTNAKQKWNRHLYISTPSSITETLPSMLPGVFNVTLKKEWSLEF